MYFLKIVLTTPTPHICKKYAPKYAIQRGSVWHKIKRFLQKVWHMDPKIWHTNPPFMPYEPFLWGVMVVFHLLNFWQFDSLSGVLHFPFFLPRFPFYPFEFWGPISAESVLSAGNFR